jgi:hypothetical protein
MKHIFILFICSLVLMCSCKEASEQVHVFQTDSAITNKQISQEIKTDSVAAAKIAVEFYRWYAEAIRLTNQDAIQPRFVKDSNGMTTLDMSAYITSLRKNKFSEHLIDKTTNSFKICLGNLDKIDYDTLQRNFDLSDYEDIGCDFFNSYQWTSDMEPHDGADVVGFSQNANDIVLKMLFYNIDNHKKSYWNYKHAEVYLIKTNDQWLIEDIEIVLNR